MQLRDMTLDDLPQVVPIEAVSFPTPWDEEMLRSEFRVPWSQRFVAVEDGTILGFVIAWMYHGEAHLMVIATHPAHRRRGIARALLAELVRRARDQACELVFLEVREGNAPAQGMYEAAGYRRAGTRKGYYKDTGEDAWLYFLPLTDKAEGDLWLG